MAHPEAQPHRGNSFPLLLCTSVPLCAISLCLGAALTLLIPGCSANDGAADVNGEVVLDGQPLDGGVIHFFPQDGQSRTTSTFIREGQFQQRVPIGKHRVEISCVKPRALRTGQDADSGTGDEIVPARYNTKSELQAEVHKGTNKVKFELMSKR